MDRQQRRQCLKRRVAIAMMRAAFLRFTVLLALTQPIVATAQSQPPAIDLAGASGAMERRAALVSLLEVQDLINAAQVARGGMTVAEADADLAATARFWTQRPPPDNAAVSLLAALRGEAETLLDYAALRVAATRAWPADRPAATYLGMATQRLDRARQAMAAATASLATLRTILADIAEILAWTSGQANLTADRDPFAGARDRALAALTPIAPGATPTKSPPRPPGPPTQLSGGRLAAATPKVSDSPPPATKPAVTTPPPTPPGPPPLPQGTLKLVYFGLYEDRVGPRGANPSGKPDGRFVLTIDATKLSSRDLTYIGLQAMDANSRPVGTIWHTRDSTQSLLLVVAGDQWLNTQYVNGLATLEGSEVDLILFADNAPEPAAVNAFIVEVGFADGSTARQLAKAR